ncbi:MAG: hypothetical protein LBB89_09175 [Treponema sp.]|jgi:hypothetical protein|nr:hypothetical protein [Treponema sp.]
MKKLIAISVVFALVAGAVFAVDVSGHVIGTVNVLQGNTDKDAAGDANKVTSGGGMDRVRIDGSGETEDGVFGGYFRIDGVHWSGSFQAAGNVWWKPIDQLKVQIGGNGGDGFFGKEGVTGWMFYQTVTDTGVAMGGDNVWGGSIYKMSLTTRDAFYAGGIDGAHDLYLFITPADIVSINLQLPFISYSGQETADVFKQTIAQLDFHLDFGNIALTYKGGRGYKEGKAGEEVETLVPVKDYFDDGGDPVTGLNTKKKETVGGVEGYDEPGKVFLYFGLTAIENLGIDFGLGYGFPFKDYSQPVAVGLGAKYTMDAFGVKFRTVVSIPMEEDQSMTVLADVLPFFSINDNIAAFVSIGLGMMMPPSAAPDGAESVVGWHFNPYLQVGSEWGAKFLVGIRAWSTGAKTGYDESKVTNWAVPIAMMVSF